MIIVHKSTARQEQYSKTIQARAYDLKIYEAWPSHIKWTEEADDIGLARHILFTLAFAE